MEVIEAALMKISVAEKAVFAASAVGIHRVFEIDNNLETVVVEIVHRLARHAESLFRGRFERLLDIEQTRLDDDDGYRDALFVAHDELEVGPLGNLRVPAARPSKQRKLHGAGFDRFERKREIFHELVGSGKTDFGEMHAE